MYLRIPPCRYRSLAGVCCRVLRLDLLLLAAYQLNALTTVSHSCEEEDVMEVRVRVMGPLLWLLTAALY